jgi:hypothetical protein
MFEALQNSGFAEFINDIPSQKRTLETLHFIGLAITIGPIMVLSIRLVGASPSIPVARLARPILWMAWLGFALVVVSGFLQFVPSAESIANRWSFQLKLGILALALANLIWLQSQIRRYAGIWDEAGAIPVAVRNMAVASIVLWPTVIIIGRLMFAFVQVDAGNSTR